MFSGRRRRFSQQRVWRKLFPLFILSILFYICRGLWLWNDRRSSSFAVATLLVNSDTYVKGALVLGKSIQLLLKNQTNNNDNIEMICMVTENVNNDYRDLLQSVGWQTKVVPSLSNPNATINARFKDTFTKLNAWRLTKYNKVLLLDADIVAVKSFKELFDLRINKKRIAAVADCCDKFNSGVVLLKPDKQIFDDMIEKTVHPDFSSYDGGDQGFLNQYFKNSWIRLAYKYNAQLPDYIDLPSAWEIDDLHLIHFEKVKPWHGPHKEPLKKIMNFWINIFKQIEKNILLKLERILNKN